ncbi:MAG TPA: efflux RND transporter periplasmic adaptor subunit [Gemmatimonadales bacterium]|nr:efflux RND transporter periplasmic adaptor subunit [Gemmatimonadales bacterium]
MDTTVSRGASLTALALAASLAGCGDKSPPPPPPPSVTVMPVQVRDVPVYREFTGETKGAEDVEIRARVAGFLERQAYTEGTPVRRGALLFVIDPKPLEAALRRARADRAEAVARFERATVQANRLRPLAAQNAVSQQDLDNALASEQASRAAVDAARAAETSAELDLSYTRVTSPIDGMAGIANVDVGQYVGSPEPTVLTVVSALDPIKVAFNISESEYLELARATSAGGRARRNPEAIVELQLADGSVHPEKGRVTIVGRGVDPGTGTMLLEAEFPNPQGIVRPGQFARVRIPVTVAKDAIIIPQRAVQELQGTYNVYVVGADSTAEIRPVKPANRVGSDWVIGEGLRAGERVIVDGLQKVRPGVKVVPTAAGASPDSAAGAR